MNYSTCASFLCTLVSIFQKGRYTQSLFLFLETHDCNVFEKLRSQPLILYYYHRLFIIPYISINHCLVLLISFTIHTFCPSPGMSPTPKIKRNVSSNKTWSSSTGTVQSVPPGLRRVTDCFTVRHFAGPVTYSVSGFVAKNFDRLPTHLINWLTDATQSDLSVGSNKSPTDEVTKPTLIQFVLTRVATGAVAGRDISASPSPGRSPLRQQNSPASSVTTRPNSSSGKHLSMRVNLQREIVNLSYVFTLCNAYLIRP